MRAVATDGHRLAQAELPLPKGAGGMPGIILPRKTVHELHRLIEGSDDTVTVGVSPAKARFEIGTITLTSKLIDGTFPDYGRVIPKGNDKVLKVSNAEFMSAVDRVSTIASERGRAVKLNISARQADPVGQQSRGRQRHRGDRRRLRRDARSRSASTPAICSTSPASSRATTAQFQLADPGSPTMVKDGSDEGALYVLMPMRV